MIQCCDEEKLVGGRKGGGERGVGGGDRREGWGEMMPVEVAVEVEV